jgi:hypothetical protein
VTDTRTAAWVAPPTAEATADDLAAIRIVNALWRYADGHGPAR